MRGLFNSFNPSERMYISMRTEQGFDLPVKVTKIEVNPNAVTSCEVLAALLDPKMQVRQVTVIGGRWGDIDGSQNAYVTRVGFVPPRDWDEEDDLMLLYIPRTDGRVDIVRTSDRGYEPFKRCPWKNVDGRTVEQTDGSEVFIYYEIREKPGRLRRFFEKYFAEW